VACVSHRPPPARRCSTCPPPTGCGSSRFGPAHGDRAAPGAAAGLSHWRSPLESGEAFQVLRADRPLLRADRSRVHALRIGVAFADMTTADRARLAKFIESLFAPGPETIGAGPGPCCSRSSWPGARGLPAAGGVESEAAFPRPPAAVRDYIKEELDHAEPVVRDLPAPRAIPSCTCRPGHRGPSYLPRARTAPASRPKSRAQLSPAESPTIELRRRSPPTPPRSSERRAASTAASLRGPRRRLQRDVRGTATSSRSACCADGSWPRRGHGGQISPLPRSRTTGLRS